MHARITQFAPARRVVVGTREPHGGSAVVLDDRNVPSTQLPNGIVLEELWQQRQIPARPSDHPQEDWTLGPAAPTAGVVVRLLTIPPAKDSVRPVDLHTDASLHVITMLSGEVTFVLEEGSATLSAGDTIILRGSMHDLQNEQPRPAQFVYTSTPLNMEVEPTSRRNTSSQ